MDYDLELERIAKKINEKKFKRIVIQLPDGLRPKATQITDYLEKKTKAKIFIWMGSCFGSCDVPDLKNIDLLIQWGHEEWTKRSF